MSQSRPTISGALAAARQGFELNADYIEIAEKHRLRQEVLL